MPLPPLEELLVQTQLVSPTQLAIAVRDAEMRHSRLAPALIELGLVDERAFAEWVSRLTRTPLLHPIADGQVQRLEHRIPRALAREYEVVPVGLDRGELAVAMLNPLDTACVDILQDATGLTIRPVVGLHGELLRLIARFFPEDDIDPTMLPGNVTIAGVADLERESPGSATVAIRPAPAVAADPEKQLAQIQKQLDTIITMIEAMQRRVEAMEQALSRVLPRDG